MSEFIFCNACGGQNKKGSEFCSTCGEKTIHIERTMPEQITPESTEERRERLDNNQRNIALVLAILIIMVAVLSALLWPFPLYICTIVDIFLVIITLTTTKKKRIREFKHIIPLVMSIISFLITVTLLILVLTIGNSGNLLGISFSLL